MKQLRFKYTVATSLLFALVNIRKAHKMMKNTEKYSEEDRYALALKMMNHMRKRSRTETDVFGEENLIEDGGYILYSNHQGKYDALGILLCHKKPCRVLWERHAANRFLARECNELLGGQTIELDDVRDSVRVLRTIAEEVKQGKRYLIFPEGRYDGNKNELLDFKTGCFYCSLNSRAPIIPVAIYDSYKAMDTNNFKKVKTEVHYLKPIFFEEYGKMTKAEIAELVKSRIRDKLAAIKARKTVPFLGDGMGVRAGE